MKRSEFLMNNNKRNLEVKKNKGLDILKVLKEDLSHPKRLMLEKFINSYFNPLFEDIISMSEILQNPNKEEGIIECYNRKTGTVYRLTGEQFENAKKHLGDTVQMVENPMSGVLRVGGDEVCKQ